jgi:hypothetical protein
MGDRPEERSGETTMVDRSHERTNEESRAELAALVAGLSQEQLRADLGEGWSVLSHLAHLGFWDRWQGERWRGLLAGSFTADPGSILDAEELANEALAPYLASIGADDVPALALEAAADVDELIAQAPDALVTQLEGTRDQFLLHRHRHRREHLGWIRRDLGLGG